MRGGGGRGGRGGRGGGGGGRRSTKDPNPPIQRPSMISITSNNRDSDASFCSNTTNNYRSNSSTGHNSTIPVNDRSYQSHALRTINSYLDSYSTPFRLKPPLPSAKDITDTIRFIFIRLDFSSDSSSSIKLDDDLPMLLKFLNCPIKLNKSALKAPGTPHAWPSLLAVIHWLVEVCLYNDHLSSSSPSTSTSTRSFLQENKLLAYALDSYSHYIRGDDDEVDALDSEFKEKLGQERDSAANKVKLLEEEVRNLEREIETLRTAPSARDALERKKSVLEEDLGKFHTYVDGVKSGIVTLEKGLAEKATELDAKVQESKRICEENDALKKTIEAQTVNLRDAERMKRELQAVERDISEAEVARNAWEEKSWDLDADLGHKFKELENLSMECNQAIKRLKLGNEFQYMLNAKGSTPAAVLGIDYKTFKVALDAFAEDVKKSSVAKLEELISLQQQSRENAAKLEAKRSRIAQLQSKIDTIEARISLIKKETEDFTSKCAMEAKRMIEDVEREGQKLDTVEREADEFVKISDMKLQDTIKQSEEGIQSCARELLALVDSVSKHKEYMESAISKRKKDLSETVEAVANVHRSSLPAEFSTFSADK